LSFSCRVWCLFTYRHRFLKGIIHLRLLLIETFPFRLKTASFHEKLKLDVGPVSCLLVLVLDSKNPKMMWDATHSLVEFVEGDFLVDFFLAAAFFVGAFLACSTTRSIRRVVFAKYHQQGVKLYITPFMQSCFAFNIYCLLTLGTLRFCGESSATASNDFSRSYVRAAFVRI